MTSSMAANATAPGSPTGRGAPSPTPTTSPLSGFLSAWSAHAVATSTSTTEPASAPNRGRHPVTEPPSAVRRTRRREPVRTLPQAKRPAEPAPAGRRSLGCGGRHDDGSPGLPRSVGGGRGARRRGDRPRAADPARRRAPPRRLPRPAVAREHLLPVLHAAPPSLGQGGRPLHTRGLRRPHGFRGAAGRGADRRGPLRPLADPLRGRGGVLRR